MAINARDLFQVGEKIGWLGFIALSVILIGLLFVHGLGLFMLDPEVWSKEHQIGLGFLSVGVLMTIFALAQSSSRVKSANKDADKRVSQSIAELRSIVDAREKEVKELQITISQTESRRAAYEEAWNIIRGHKAVSYLDNPEFIRKVIDSAITLQSQMDELLTNGKLDKYAQEFTVQIRRFAKDFYIDCEQLERERLLPTKEECPNARLSDHPEAFCRAVRYHKRWTNRTEALFSGAAAMLGIVPPRFDW